MHDNPTEWQPTTPGHVGYLWHEEIGIPPPPPHSKKARLSFILLLLLIILLLFLGGVVFFLYMTQNHHANQAQHPPAARIEQPSPSPVPTQKPMPTVLSSFPQNYTATDIMNDFESTGVQPASLGFGITIWTWSGDAFFVTVHATSSVSWADVSTCSGPCDPNSLGLWVYNSYSAAAQAHNDVLNDEYFRRGTPSGGQGVADSNTPAYLHGRCVLLGYASYRYIQVLDQYCV